MSDNIDLYAIRDPIIPDANNIDGGKGIGINDIEDGLLVYSTRYTNMATGDVLKIFWGREDIPADEVTVTSTEEPVFFRIPKAFIEEGWSYTFVTLSRLSGSTDSSLKVNVFVKLSIPGGLDPNPVTDRINENLPLPTLPADIIAEGATENNIIGGVPVIIHPYENKVAGDKIELYWGSVSVSHTVLAGEVVGDITILVSEDMIRAAGDSNALAVRYQVFDLVENWSKWSRSVEILVDIGVNRLPAPAVPQAQNGIIDLDVLDNKDVAVQVFPYPPDFVKNETVEMLWEGMTEDGNLVPFSQTLIVDVVPGLLTFTVPYDKVQAISRGQVTVSYVLHRQGNLTRPSRRLTLKVVGDAVTLDTPVVNEAVGGMLSPDLPRATVTIPDYSWKQNGDQITLIWRGEKSDGSPYLWQEIFPVTSAMIGLAITRSVAGEHISVLSGGKLTVYYQVLPVGSASNPPLESEKLELTLLDDDQQLPAPEVPDAKGTTLDPDDVPTGVKVLINPYTDMAEDDKVLLTWAGGNVSTSDTLTVSGALVGKVLEFTIGPEFIQPNLNNNVTIYYQVTHAAGGNQTSDSLILHIERQADVDDILVTGNRSLTAPHYYSNLSRLVISPLPEVIHRWQYEGESHWLEADEFDDAQPWRALTITRIKADKNLTSTTLRPANVSAIFDFGRWRSLVVVKDDGSLFFHGPATIAPPVGLSGIKTVVSSLSAYAARHADGTVTAWGEAAAGGSINAQTQAALNDVQSICSTSRAFAALTFSGSIITWGAPEYGGSIPETISAELHDVVQIVGADNGFAVLRADGEVFCWGGDQWPWGMHVMAAKGSANLRASNRAFAALLQTGSVVAWGDADQGGRIPAETQRKLSGIVKLASTSEAFTALSASGNAVSWGNPRFGGLSPTGLSGVKHVLGSTTAFVAVKSNNQLESWGEAGEGGTLPGPITARNVVATYGSFSALLETGTTTTWGLNHQQSNADNVLAIYPAGSNFISINNHSELSSWGEETIDVSSLSGLVSYTQS